MEFAERIKAFRDTVPLDRPVVSYCDGAECRSSEILAQALAKAARLRQDFEAEVKT